MTGPLSSDPAVAAAQQWRTDMGLRSDAAWVEQRHADGRRGIVAGGSTYGCVFTGGAANNLFSLSMLKRPTGGGPDVRHG